MGWWCNDFPGVLRACQSLAGIHPLPQAVPLRTTSASRVVRHSQKVCPGQTTWMDFPSKWGGYASPAPQAELGTAPALRDGGVPCKVLQTVEETSTRVHERLHHEEGRAVLKGMSDLGKTAEAIWTTKLRSTRFNYLNTTSTTAIDSGADQQPGAAGTRWHRIRALGVPRSRERAKPRQWWLGRLVAARSSPTLEAISGLVGMGWPLEAVDEHCIGGSIQPVGSRWSCSSTRFCARLAPSTGLRTWDLGKEQHPLCPEGELFSQQGGAGVAQPVARWWHQETRWRWTFRSVVCGLWGRRLHGRHGGTIWKSGLGIPDHGWSLWGWVCHPGRDRCIGTWGLGSHRTRPPNTQRSPREATSGEDEPSVLLITALATTPTTGSTWCTRDKIYYMSEVWRTTSCWRVPQEGLQGHGDPHRRGSFCVFCRGPGSTGSMRLRRTRPSTGSYDPRSHGARQGRHRRRSNSNPGLRCCVGKDHGDQLGHQGWDGPTSDRSWTEADVRVRKLIQWPMFVNCMDEDFCWGSQWTTEDSCSWQGFRSCAVFCGNLAITRSSHRLFRGSHCLQTAGSHTCDQDGAFLYRPPTSSHDWGLVSNCKPSQFTGP